MIYYDGISSIIECVYLSETLGNRIGSCDIFVNPDSVSYMAGKIVIINTTDYPGERIDQAVKNNNKVISRVYYPNQGIEVSPYILRINLDIMWNGRFIESEGNDLDDLLDSGDISYSLSDGILYFPKLSTKSGLTDDYGNLTSLGWALHQVGVNCKQDTPFYNLDLVKTQKLMF